MQLKLWYRNTVLLLVTGVGAAASAQSSSVQPNAGQSASMNVNDPDRQEAFRLYRAHKLPEAAVLLEEVVAKYPNDLGVHEALGVALLSRSATQDDPEKRKVDRLRARAELLRAQELGDKSDLCRVILAGIPEDGSEKPFSDRKDVAAAMNRGEAFFANGEFDQAIQEYSRALEMDPRLYLAAVNIGDSYFRLRKMDQAGVWFAQAIRIAPDEEIAYRYWGDGLLSEGKIQEARTTYIEGLVANPYATTSWGGLNNWMARTHLTYRKFSIRLPQPPTIDAKGNTTVTVDPSSLGKNDGGAAWMVYPMERSLWQKEKFSKEFTREKTYRHSLKEEAAALTLTATVFDETQQKKKAESLDPSLLLLSKLKAEGFIEAYVLLVLPDDGIARDYAAYRTANRAKLIEFVDKYIVPHAP